MKIHRLVVSRALMSALVFLILKPAPGLANSIEDPTQTLSVVESKFAKRKFRWQSTKNAATLVKISADAFGPDPIADIIGVLGIAISVPLTIIAVPFDLLAYPFRWNRVMTLRVRGKAVDSNRMPFRNAEVELLAQGKYPESDIFSFPLFNTAIPSTSDENGLVDASCPVSFGPNSSVSFSVGIKAKGTVRSYWLIRHGRHIKVTSLDFPNSWKLLPLDKEQ